MTFQASLTPPLTRALPPSRLIRADKIAQAIRHYPFAVRQAFAFAGMLEKGELDVLMPDGQHFHFFGRDHGPKASMIVHDMAFARRLAGGGDVGIAEAYLRGEWESPDLPRFLELFCANQPMIARLLEGKPIVRFLQMISHWLNRNTKSGSKRNIHAHYDLGNAFYSAWLDPGMTYSSALFLGSDRNLESGQRAKYAALATDIGLGPDNHVLEIGCGWGGFAEFAARDIGCKVTGLTISKAQFDFAQKRIFEAGLNEKITLKLQDYRDETGNYDRIASIEMFEAVGEAYWPTYFGQLRDRLTPGGIAGMQVITIHESIFGNYRREMDFIRRYIFPGGMLPTPTILRDMGGKYGFRISAERAFGQDYALTLSHWRDSFRNAWPKLTLMGFDEKFRRLWEYYLAYCEAGFLVGTIDVRHMAFAKG